MDSRLSRWRQWTASYQGGDNGQQADFQGGDNGQQPAAIKVEIMDTSVAIMIQLSDELIDNA